MSCYETFITLLLHYNKTHNITGLKTKDEIKINIQDAIFPIKYLKNIKTAIDVGTGAGFPGLILAMAMPQTFFYLVEPISKRSAFLHLVKAKCNLQNVKIINDRIENLKPFKVDLITSRAVTKTDLLIKLAHDFITPDTTLLFYKGESVEDELDKKFSYNIVKRDKRRYLFIKGII